MESPKFEEIKSPENLEQIKEFVLIVIKPLGMHEEIRGIIDDKLHRYGQVKSSKQVVTTKQLMKQHYLESQFDKDGSPKPYYPVIVEYMSHKTVDVIILEDTKDRSNDDKTPFAKRLRRDVIGSARPQEAHEGSIRRMAVEKNLDYIQYPKLSEEQIIEGVNFCTDNLIHCSDGIDSALREVELWFEDEPEIVERYRKIHDMIKNREESD